MAAKQDQQLFQVQNILETLLEATDHFSALIQQREFNQSVYAFTSIVEGAQAVVSPLNQLDQAFNKHTQKLEQHLAKIAGHLENGEMNDIPALLQFALRPLFVQLIETFQAKFGDQKESTDS